MLKLTEIKIDGGTQQRARICQDTVAEYKAAYLADAELPPVVVYFDGAEYWLVDGFHRWHAARDAGMTHIDAEIVNGTRRAAVLASVGVNAAHGLKRSNADKRRAVQTLLDDAEWGQWSSREIARACAVGHTLVDDMREKPVAVKFKNRHGGESERKVTMAEMPLRNDQPEVAETPPCKPEPVQPADPLPPAANQPATPQLEPAEPPDATEIEELRESLDILRDDHDRMTARLAVAAMEATDEERTMAADLIAELREENRILKINLDAVTASRDGLMRERNEMLKQIKMQRKELDKLKNQTNGKQ